MVKILHCADIHLDCPFTTLDLKSAEVMRAQLRGAFTSMMLRARTNNVDIILMAGDIFDCDYVTKETVELLKREFSQAENIKIVITPGNHDPFTEESVWNKVIFPENVYIFKSESVERISFESLGVDVYGYAFTNRSMEANPLSYVEIADKTKINVLCAHADMASPISSYCPITVSEIEESEFDYVALGHIHNSDGVHKVRNTYYAYSGCLCGRDFGETGVKGALMLGIEKEEGNLSVVSKQTVYATRRYEICKIDVTGAQSIDEICDYIRRAVSENGYGDDTVLRVILTGEVTPGLDVSANFIRENITSVFSLDIVDSTLPTYDSETLKNDPTIKGAFYNRLLPMLTSGSAQDRKIAAIALRYGLRALDGEDFIDF